MNQCPFPDLIQPLTRTAPSLALPFRPARPPSHIRDRALFLFIPFYTPPDSDRAAELLYCLDRNLETELFARIILMIDDDSPVPRPDRRIGALRLGRRPTYLDWLCAAQQICPGHIAVLANSDIHFDASISRLADIFAADSQSFIALSRFDRRGADLIAHPNPHWSQDTWAVVPSADGILFNDTRFDVPLGVPRCDNKIAYVFATQGYKVVNPFPVVRSIHVHETDLRYYNKKEDRRVLGGVAYVHPNATLTEPAKLDLDIWTVRSSQVNDVKVNRSLEKWAEEARIAALPRPAWLAHDADWQYPAITEKHAFIRMQEELPAEPGVFDAAYLGFPFATLLDLHAQHGPDHPRTRTLQGALDAMIPGLKKYQKVVTVSQHIRARQFSQIFANAGVTDLFWSHCTIGENEFPGSPPIRVHPFPLYPVQMMPRGEDDIDRPRRWLFSFVGARAQKNYLSDVRTLIIEILSSDPRGKVIDREAWHYQKVVYDAQVLGRVQSSPDLVNENDSAVFRDVMDNSVFTLCPSGSGPNSIRLWEAMVNGSIPVILSDTWAAPGDPELWQAATIRCAETAEAVAALPERLEAVAGDPERLRAMREALSVLTERYGPEGFVGDLEKLILPEQC